MLKTPEHITRQFGIEATAGQDRAVPRILFAYGDRRTKARFLATTISLIMSGALPEEGQRRTWSRSVTQGELAAMCGIARETYTRRLSEFANPDEAWTVERRLAQRDRTLLLHQKRGHGLHEKQRPVRPNISTLIRRRRRFMRPNAYNPALPAGSGKNPANWHWPKLADLMATSSTREVFEDPGASFKIGGHKRIPMWVWDKRLPLSNTARLVLSYYFFCGLLDRRNGRVFGMVHPMQSTVARALGLSVKSVYNANQELSSPQIALIRVFHRKPTVLPDGRFYWPPVEILYLPTRQLSHDEAEAERNRLRRALDATRATAAPWMVSRLKELHEELLKAWAGQEHSLSAFWSAVRKRSIAEGIHQSAVINQLLPLPPE